MSGPLRHRRVLHVLACDDLAGTELMVAALVERTDRAILQPEVATLDGPGALAARLRDADVPVVSLGGAGSTRALWRLVGLLHRRRFDVVEAYGLRASLITRFALRLLSPGTTFICGVRGLHVTEVQNLHSARARAVIALERLTSPLVDVYDANSRGAVEYLASAGISRHRLHYIPNGVDVAAWRESTPDPTAPPLVLCVARLVEHKRHRDLIRALASLRAQGQDVRATFAGEGPARQALESLVVASGLEDVVRMPGSLGRVEVRDLLAEASVFCLASLWEGMPGSVLEAMAAGVPVVGTSVNGIRDLVVEGKTGMLVPPRNAECLAEALAGLLQDPDRSRQMGANGRRLVEREFSLDRMVAAKQRLYLEGATR